MKIRKDFFKYTYYNIFHMSVHNTHTHAQIDRKINRFNLNTQAFITMHIYMCVCMCVCVCVTIQNNTL